MTRAEAFEVVVVRIDGSVGSVLVEAQSKSAAAAEIRAGGGFPISVEARMAIRPRRARVSGDELAQGLRSLATLLNSGVSLGKTLAILPDLAPQSWATSLPEVRRRVEQGEPLSAVLQTPELGVPAHVIGLIEAGEGGSGLAAAVADAAGILEQHQIERTAFRNALAYPVLLAASGGASMMILVGVVLPRLANLLSDMGQALPLSTRIVLSIGSATRAALLPAIFTVAILSWAWRSWTSDTKGMAIWHGWLLRLPIVGSLRASIATANACSVLGALAGAGVPIATALTHGARACGDSAIEARLQAVKTRITRGEGLAHAIQAERAFTSAATRLARAGEETGTLAEMLRNASRVEAARARQLLQRAVRTIEPGMILAFGAVVLAVAAGLLQAMYGLRPPT